MVAYLDVLGFRDRIEKSKGNAFEVTQIYGLLRHLQQEYSRYGHYEMDQDNQPRNLVLFRSFSDLMIRVTKTQSPTKLANYLNWEIFVLANIQCEAVAVGGDLLRGVLVSCASMTM